MHGTLRLIRDGDYAPQIGGSFPALDFDSDTAEFDAIVPEGLVPNVALAPAWSQTGMTLNVAAAPEPAPWGLLLASIVMIGMTDWRRRKVRLTHA